MNRAGAVVVMCLLHITSFVCVCACMVCVWCVCVCMHHLFRVRAELGRYVCVHGVCVCGVYASPLMCASGAWPVCVCVTGNSYLS